jgi:L-threonylcarbamoyladenylate synthase
LSRVGPVTDESVNEAAAILRAGGLVAFPTETVYGLGADATNDRAVARIFEAKQRPEFNPLIVHVPNLEAARAHAIFGVRSQRLADRFWPGALTLVLARREGSDLSLLVSAGLDTVALRCPAHEIARRLLAAAGRPVAAPSANRSGRISPTTASHVADDLGDAVDLILDGGPCPIGVESTIVDVTGDTPLLLRPGGVTREAIESEIGSLGTPDDASVRAPGMLASHYAPRAPLRLNAQDAAPGEVLLAFGPDAPAGAVNLSASGDLVEAAANLFAMLRDLDDAEPGAIAVMPVPEHGLGVAINDRLARAAAPRA